MTIQKLIPKFVQERYLIERKCSMKLYEVTNNGVIELFFNKYLCYCSMVCESAISLICGRISKKLPRKFFPGCPSLACEPVIYFFFLYRLSI